MSGGSSEADITAFAVIPRGSPVAGSCALITVTALARSAKVARNACGPAPGASRAAPVSIPGWSDECVTGVEREPERHPAVVLRGSVEVAEHVAGDGPHVAPATLDRALVPQRAGARKLHQILHHPHQDPVH